MHQSPTKASVVSQAQAGVGRFAVDNAVMSEGRVVWITIDGVSLPCIIRDGKLNGPVRILEDRLLNKLPSRAAVNAAFQNRQLIVSKYLTAFEALQLTGNAGDQFGVFTRHDLVVNIDEFRDLFTYLKSVQHDSTTAVTGGWLQVNNR